MTEYVPSPADLATIFDGPTRVWISGPSIVAPKEKFDLRISLLRSDGYLSTDFEGALLLEGNTGIEGLPGKIVFSKGNRGTSVFSCSISEKGIHRFKIVPAKGSFPSGECHPIWVRAEFPYRLYWGDLHVHSVLGKCGVPHLPKHPDFGYWYARRGRTRLLWHGGSRKQIESRGLGGTQGFGGPVARSRKIRNHPRF